MTENHHVPDEQAPDEPANELGGDKDCLQARATCREELEERLQALLWARADLDNQANRAERELEKTHKYAVSGLVEARLPVHDSLELGLAAARHGRGDPPPGHRSDARKTPGCIGEVRCRGRRPDG